MIPTIFDSQLIHCIMCAFSCSHLYLRLSDLLAAEACRQYLDRFIQCSAQGYRTALSLPLLINAVEWVYLPVPFTCPFLWLSMVHMECAFHMHDQLLAFQYLEGSCKCVSSGWMGQRVGMLEHSMTADIKLQPTGSQHWSRVCMIWVGGLPPLHPGQLPSQPTPCPGPSCRRYTTLLQESWLPSKTIFP